jgi:hypothetical protein
MRRFVLLFALCASFVLLGCSDSSGKIVEADTHEPDTVVPPDTVTAQTPAFVGVVSGAGVRESANYKMRISVGSISSPSRLSSENYKATIGVGAP